MLGTIRWWIAAVLFSPMATTSTMAEWYGDVYGGTVSTRNHDVPEEISNGGVTVTHTFLDVKTDDATTFGGRIGYWFESMPWLGVGVDLFHFRPTMKQQSPLINVAGANFPSTFRQIDFSVTAIAFDLRLRWPLLTSAQFPNGQLQPYFSAGPAFSRFRVKDTNHFTPNNQSDTDTPVGIKLGVGVSWRITQRMAIFGEYRATRFKPEANFTTDNPAGTSIHMKTNLDSRQLLAGFSFPF